MPASDAVHTLERMDKRGSMFDGKEDGELSHLLYDQFWLHAWSDAMLQHMLVMYVDDSDRPCRGGPLALQYFWG